MNKNQNYTKKNQRAEERQNYIKQNFLSSQTYFVLCLHIIKIDKKDFLFCAFYLAAKKIVAHCFIENNKKVSDITDTLSKILTKIVKDRGFLPKVKIIHSKHPERMSDRDSLFNNHLYYDFLNQHQIAASRESANAHDNIVIERTFRSIKELIRKKLAIAQKQKTVFNDLYPFSEKAQFIEQVIDFYNNKPHKGLYGMTPNNMENALFCRQHGTNIIDKNSTSLNTLSSPKQISSVTFQESGKSLISLTSNTPERPQGVSWPDILKGCYSDVWESLKVIDVLPAYTKSEQGELANKDIRYKQTVIQGYYEDFVEDTLKFLIDFKSQTINNYFYIINQNNLLYQQKLDMKRDLDIVKSELQVMRDQRVLKEERAHKRKNATIQNQREIVTQEEFTSILELVKQNNFVASRRKTALLLLYVTGLRVSSLLNLKIFHIQEFLDKGKTQIPLRKKGEKPYHITLSEKSCEWFKQFYNNFSQLMIDKERDNFFFTTQKQFDKPINRSSFDAELNSILTKASEKFGKHIRTHSFRTSIITDFLKDTPIDVVKEVMGHKDIKTTYQYKKGNVSKENFQQVYNHLDQERESEKIV